MFKYNEHIGQIDTNSSQPVNGFVRLRRLARHVVIGGDTALGHRLKCRLRNGADRVGRDEFGDIHRVGVRGIFDAGRGP